MGRIMLNPTKNTFFGYYTSMDIRLSSLTCLKIPESHTHFFSLFFPYEEQKRIPLKYYMLSTSALYTYSLR